MDIVPRKLCYSRKQRMTTKLYKANHLYLMKIALIEKTSREIKPLQSRVIKKTHQTKIKEIVPISAARQRAINKIFHQPRQINNPNKMRKWSKIPKEYHPSIPKPSTPIKFRKNQGTSVRKISNYVDEKQQTHRTSHRSAKINSNKKPFRMLHHHYRWKQHLSRQKLKNQNHHQVINNNQQQ